VRALVAAPVRLSAEIGRRLMPVAEVLHLEEGQLVELDSGADDPADLYVNGRRLGAGKLVLVDGEWALQIEWLAGDTDVHVESTSAEYEDR
jgi:flagellar motor switch protein FliN/FliY